METKTKQLLAGLVFLLLLGVGGFCLYWFVLRPDQVDEPICSQLTDDVEYETCLYDYIITNCEPTTLSSVPKRRCLR